MPDPIQTAAAVAAQPRPRREQLSPEEIQAIAAGSGQWFPGALGQQDEEPLPSLMASPAKQGLIGGLMGGAMGVGTGSLLGGLGGHPLIGMGIGAGLLGGVGAAERYLSQKQYNKHIEEVMRRLPAGAKRKDYDAEDMLAAALRRRFRMPFKFSADGLKTAFEKAAAPNPLWGRLMGGAKNFFRPAGTGSSLFAPRVANMSKALADPTMTGYFRGVTPPSKALGAAPTMPSPNLSPTQVSRWYGKFVGNGPSNSGMVQLPSAFGQYARMPLGGVAGYGMGVTQTGDWDPTNPTNMAFAAGGAALANPGMRANLLRKAPALHGAGMGAYHGGIAGGSIDLARQGIHGIGSLAGSDALQNWDSGLDDTFFTRWGARGGGGLGGLQGLGRQFPKLQNVPGLGAATKPNYLGFMQDMTHGNLMASAPATGNWNAMTGWQKARSIPLGAAQFATGLPGTPRQLLNAGKQPLASTVGAGLHVPVAGATVLGLGSGVVNMASGLKTNIGDAARMFDKARQGGALERELQTYRDMAAQIQANPRDQAALGKAVALLTGGQEIPPEIAAHVGLAQVNPTTGKPLLDANGQPVWNAQAVQERLAALQQDVQGRKMEFMLQQTGRTPEQAATMAPYAQALSDLGGGFADTKAARAQLAQLQSPEFAALPPAEQAKAVAALKLPGVSTPQQAVAALQKQMAASQAKTQQIIKGLASDPDVQSGLSEVGGAVANGKINEMLGRINNPETGKPFESVDQAVEVLNKYSDMLKGRGGGMLGAFGAIEGIADQLLGGLGIDTTGMSGLVKGVIILGGLGLLAGGVSAMFGQGGMGMGLGGLGLLAGGGALAYHLYNQYQQNQPRNLGSLGQLSERYTTKPEVQQLQQALAAHNWDASKYNLWRHGKELGVMAGPEDDENQRALDYELYENPDSALRPAIEKALPVLAGS